MGIVFEAQQKSLARTVAIKVLPERTAGAADLKERFQREAKAISSLNHPNICILFDVGEEDGRDFLVMEYLEGETLAEIEHEVRSLSHAMYHRNLVNRNPAVNFFTYRKGNEIYTPE